MSVNGWIKMHRRAVESPTFCDEGVWHLFCWLLANATRQPYKAFRKVRTSRLVVDLEPGQYATSEREMSEQYGRSRNAIRSRLKALSDLETITIDKRDNYLIITIPNWEKYQDEPPHDWCSPTEQQSPLVFTKGPQNGPQNGPQSGGIHILKQEERERGTTAVATSSKKRTRPEDVVIPSPIDTPAVRKTIGEWFAQRRAKKLSVRIDHITRCYERLARLTPDQAVACLRHTIDNDYSGLFPDKFRSNGQQPARIDRKRETKTQKLARLGLA